METINSWLKNNKCGLLIGLFLLLSSAQMKAGGTLSEKLRAEKRAIPLLEDRMKFVADKIVMLLETILEEKKYSLNAQEKEALEQFKINSDAGQIWLVARLLSKIRKGEEIILTQLDDTLFKTLSPYIQQILKNKKIQSKQQQELFEKKKADMRRYFEHPKFNDKKTLNDTIDYLKTIYVPDNDHYEAFTEVIKEMGYGESQAPLKTTDRIQKNILPTKEAMLEKHIAEKVNNLQPNEYFVYAAGTAEGIVVSDSVLKLSPVIQTMLKDLGVNRAIPIVAPIETIKNLFKALDPKEDAYFRSNATRKYLTYDITNMQLLVDVTNLAHFLNFPMDPFVGVIVNKLRDINHKFQITSSLLSNEKFKKASMPEKRKEIEDARSRMSKTSADEKAFNALNKEIVKLVVYKQESPMPARAKNSYAEKVRIYLDEGIIKGASEESLRNNARMAIDAAIDIYNNSLWFWQKKDAISK
jgi:hypothetical protein